MATKDGTLIETMIINDSSFELRRRNHNKSCYRYTLPEPIIDCFPKVFAQITKISDVPVVWEGTIRNVHTGKIQRYFGLWNTRRDAENELKVIAKEKIN